MDNLRPASRSQFEIRDEVFDAVVRDLLGPAEGEEEEFATSPRDRYLLGQLAPQGQVIEPEMIEDVATGGNGTLEEGQPEPATLPTTSLMPSSIGITFAVDGGVQSIQVRAAWGRYQRAKSERFVTESGSARTVWKRVPAGGGLQLPLLEGTDVRLVPDERFPDVQVEAAIRRGSSGDWIVTLFLVNGQATPEKNEEEAWLFQPELHVASQEGVAVFRRRSGLGLSGDETSVDTDERRLLAMQYRRHLEFAVGHGVAVHAAVDPTEPEVARSITTRVIPFHDVPDTDAQDVPGLANLVVDMKELSELDTEHLVAELSRISGAYERWILRQEQRLERGELSGYEPAARTALGRCRRALARLVAGIDLIGRNPYAADAFRFANQAMWLQRVHSEYALRRRRGETLELDEVDSADVRSWYPFQLAFILIALPSLTDPTHEERMDPTSAVADLLWFPAGGGKTEAYLGVAAYAIGLRRLQGTVNGYDGRFGVAVMMRYTLRLLTVQQFQRASTLLCAMEVIRRGAIKEGEPKWGVEPFRIGLWVGARATPNTTADSATAIREARKDTWSRGTGTPYQLTNCPWCGSRIEPGRDLIVDADLQRTITYCSDRLGECPFSRRQATREGLPVVVVDEEIYKLLPALLIGTVDKFAQMPWKGEVAALFGRVTGRCLRHGFLNPESTESGRHPKRGEFPAIEPAPAGPLRPPDLVIQDELHLISGPLGSMVGLYETAVDKLCEWNHGEVTVRPKVIASTATIRRASDQVHGLFLRRVEVFPPRGLDVEDNFFSRQLRVSTLHPGRRYFGICAPGRSRPAVLIRMYVALLAAAGRAYRDHGGAADPWMTLVGYFNSLRELGGMRRLVEDDVQTRVLRIERDADLPRPGLAGRLIPNTQELTSRLSSDRIPYILDWLEEGFDPGSDGERDAARKRGETPKRRPIDVLLATNMVSVGVDVRRLGLMVVAGQPKNTAEYIQATSRVGRASPGLVAAVLNWSRPRDLSHYERFEHYHATFYQYVEALSLTPFAKRAVDRGLSGLLVSLLRLRVRDLTPNNGAGKLDRTAAYTDEVVAEIARRAWSVSSDATLKEVIEDTLEARLDEWRHEAELPNRSLAYKPTRSPAVGGTAAPLLKSPEAGPWEAFTLLNSLRDVEPPVPLIKIEPRTHGGLPDWKAPPKPEPQE